MRTFWWLGEEIGVEDDEDELGVEGVSGGFAIGSCGEATVDFRFDPRFSWLSDRGKRARKFGAVTVVVVVAVTFVEAVVMIAISDAVELCERKQRRGNKKTQKFVRQINTSRR